MAGDATAVRVRQLITESGLTQAVFAGKVGLDESKMSKSLSGVRRFTSLDLARIADLCGVSVDWLLGASSLTPSMAARTSTDTLTASDAAIREAERLAQLRADLAFLGYRQDVPKFRWAPTSLLNVDQGRDLAVSATECAAAKEVTLWRSRDLAEAVETAFGVDVRVHRLPDGFDGLSWVNEEASLIVVGTSEFPARQRFTIAHELGHLLAGDDQGLHVDANIQDAVHKRKPSEVRANAFAAELLLPGDILREESAHTTWSRETFARLACRLWVSPSTLAWRLFNLKLIDRSLCDSFRTMTAGDAAGLTGSFESFGEWLQHSSTPRIPRLLVRATAQAYADGKATLRPFANLIGRDTDTLRQAISETREDSPLAL
ncbi:helix-turn-helix domain-containing protein [Streptosporangium lutulentum]|uniref:Zn-dependent peptidase ImmA (M78 family)/transcriptional regulator with XRE-family HTH domain n=1 Tax=Streptosporangium lutulentum TaxID=1461250 RepID=A0ABT9QIP7_9ACTN|nr:XRE family transcriptional regulator [Streptosporangium lutulentum]MDP9846246.1 Zn-dependent peptidase ImmA (M78 family)/transcriptional regulator with XRE-family HTH domain [Streptosporangium lutulentum]